MTKRKINTIIKRTLSFLIAITILAGEIGWSDIFHSVVMAASPEPEFGLSIESVQGANTELVDEEKQYYMLRNMQETDFSLNLKPMYTQGISVHGAEITVQTPYIVTDENGDQTANYDDKTYNANALLMQFTDLPSNWIVKGTATTTVYQDGEPIAPDDTTDSWEGKIINKGYYFAGAVTLSYTAANGLGATNVGFNAKAKFLGDISENFGFAIQAGMGYDSYEDSMGSIYDSSFQIQVGGNPQKDDGNYNEVCLIHSNLQWEQTVTNISDTIAMWREYNYIVTKVKIENISENSTSAFEKFDINLNIPSAATSGQNGVIDRDIMAWIYKDGQEPEQNTSIEPEDRNNVYVGKANEGGVLVYDITDMSEADLSKVDISEFSDTSALGDELPYMYASDGNVHIKIDQKLDNEVKQKTYLIAVPYRASIMMVGNKVSHGVVSTVYYGKDGIYSWSKQTLTSVKVDSIVHTITQDKYVKDSNGTIQDTTDAFVGQPSSYYIGNIGNYQVTENGNINGNVPVYNAFLIDTIPEGFELSDLQIHTANGVDLSDWFRQKDTVQYEVEDPVNGQKSWVTCELTQDTDALGNPINVWTADLEENIPENWTRRIRVAYKEEIRPGEVFDGYIQVNGKISKLGTYTNTVLTESEKHIYVYDIDTQSGKWQITPMINDESSATLIAKPAGPDVDGVGVYYDQGTTPILQDGVEVSMNDSSAGFRFYLNNTSMSYMVPAVFYTDSNLLTEIVTENPNTKEYSGFFTESIVFSANLLATSQIEYIKLIGYDTKQDGTNNIPLEFVLDKQKIEELLETENQYIKYDNGNLIILSGLW